MQLKDKFEIQNGKSKDVYMVTETGILGYKLQRLTTGKSKVDLLRLPLTIRLIPVKK